jgi:hypothetical protein
MKPKEHWKPLEMQTLQRLQNWLDVVQPMARHSVQMMSRRR